MIPPSTFLLDVRYKRTSKYYFHVSPTRSRPPRGMPHNAPRLNHGRCERTLSITLDTYSMNSVITTRERYMHGPIPMKVESCRVEVLRACLSPLQILRQGSFQAELTGLRTFGRRTHEDEWDEVRIWGVRALVRLLIGSCSISQGRMR